MDGASNTFSFAFSARDLTFEGNKAIINQFQSARHSNSNQARPNEHLLTPISCIVPCQLGPIFWSGKKFLGFFFCRHYRNWVSVCLLRHSAPLNLNIFYCFLVAFFCCWHNTTFLLNVKSMFSSLCRHQKWDFMHRERSCQAHLSRKVSLCTSHSTFKHQLNGSARLRQTLQSSANNNFKYFRPRRESDERERACMHVGGWEIREKSWGGKAENFYF